MIYNNKNLWAVKGREGQLGKEGKDSEEMTATKGREGQQEKDGEERMARKGKNSEERKERIARKFSEKGQRGKDGEKEGLPYKELGWLG